MIYIIDNGQGYEDAQIHFVEAPESFCTWWHEKYLPWQESKSHIADPQDSTPAYSLLGVAPSVSWENGNSQEEGFDDFVKGKLYAVKRGSRRIIEPPPSYKPW